MSEHHENYENHENHEHQEATSTQNDNYITPSAPPAHDDNGYIVVAQTPQSSMDNAIDSVVDALTANKQQEEITRLLADLSNNAESTLKDQQAKVVAEADSSVIEEPPVPKQKEVRKEKEDKSSDKRPSACPYYCLAMDYISKVEVPPKVRDLLLWNNPKVTGAVFGSLFALLISLASFSLLTVVSSLLLTGLVVLGAYRFYLALMFRIKGTYDNTFDKLSQFDLSLPKDKVQNLAHLLETDANRLLNKLKSILLWDNITTSVLAFIVLYVVYCVGSMFNTLTLLILDLVALFTLPKVYQVYQKQIDQGIAKATDVAHNLVKQVLEKVPILNKKKQQ